MEVFPAVAESMQSASLSSKIQPRVALPVLLVSWTYETAFVAEFKVHFCKFFYVLKGLLASLAV